MKLNKQKVVEILRSKGVSHLYHANSVKTSCTFIQQGGLLSRGAVESKGLVQTSQESDELDKKYGVWNDIFLDSVDLHERFNRNNKYGPVLFKFNLNLLTDDSTPPIWITKNNPMFWNGDETDEVRYMQSEQELNRLYEKGAHREMITLRFVENVLPFGPYLEEVIVDSPGVKIGDIVLRKEATKAIREALDQYGVDVPGFIRKCDSCWCRVNYLREVPTQTLRKLFLP
jgi:hypothetical protein